MRKLVFALISIFVFSFPVFTVSLAQAAPLNPFQQVCNGAGEGASSDVCQQQGTENPISGPNGIILTAVRLLSFVIGVIAVIMVIVGGLKYIMSNGDSNAVSAAKNTVLYAIIGLVIFAASQAIIGFVISKL